MKASGLVTEICKGTKRQYPRLARRIAARADELLAISHEPAAVEAKTMVMGIGDVMMSYRGAWLTLAALRLVQVERILTQAGRLPQ